MTEIGNTNSNTQVIPLRNASVSRPESDTVERATTRLTQTTPLAAAVQPPLKEENATQITERDAFERAAEVLEELIPEIEQTPNTRLRIDRDEETGRFIYSNVDNESGEVIRQFPPESLLEFLSTFRSLEGLVIDDEI